MVSAVIDQLLRQVIEVAERVKRMGPSDWLTPKGKAVTRLLRAIAQLQKGEMNEALNTFSKAARKAEEAPRACPESLIGILAYGWGITAAYYALTAGFLAGRSFASKVHSSDMKRVIA